MALTRAKQTKINKALKNLFCIITEDEFLCWDQANKTLATGGRSLTPQEVQALAEEARYIQNTRLWPLLLKELQYLAAQSMYHKATAPEQMIFPKATLYVIDLISKKLAKLSKFK